MELRVSRAVVLVCLRRLPCTGIHGALGAVGVGTLRAGAGGLFFCTLRIGAEIFLFIFFGGTLRTDAEVLVLECLV